MTQCTPVGAGEGVGACVGGKLAVGGAVALDPGEVLGAPVGGALADEGFSDGETCGAGVEVQATTSATTPATTDRTNRIRALVADPLCNKG